MWVTLRGLHQEHEAERKGVLSPFSLQGSFELDTIRFGSWLFFIICFFPKSRLHQFPLDFFCQNKRKKERRSRFVVYRCATKGRQGSRNLSYTPQTHTTAGRGHADERGVTFVETSQLSRTRVWLETYVPNRPNQGGYSCKAARPTQGKSLCIYFTIIPPSYPHPFPNPNQVLYSL